LFAYNGARGGGRRKMNKTKTQLAGERTQIKRAYIRHYSDSGQTTAYIEWTNGSRTEGERTKPHMLALLRRALNEIGKVDYETW
jgi:hypothetical protein